MENTQKTEGKTSKVLSCLNKKCFKCGSENDLMETGLNDGQFVCEYCASCSEDNPIGKGIIETQRTKFTRRITKMENIGLEIGKITEIELNQKVVLTTSVGICDFTIPIDFPQTIFLDVYGRSYRIYRDGKVEEESNK